MQQGGPVNYGSVCSGVEAASLAWEPLGWKPVFFSEVDAFPSAVLAERWPNVPNMGDMTKFEGWGYERGAIDILVGGTPCQSFSIAGLRRGLDDDRGNLALVYCRILERLRPRWFVWENVPGVLSSNGGRDLGAILGAFSELGYSFAYRILDAQSVGGCELHSDARGWGPVPQRRRRVFVVGHSGDWRAPAAVLFERESVRGDSQASRKAGEETASNTRDGLETRNWPKRVAPTLNAAFGKKLGLEDQHALGGGGCSYLPKRSLCLNAGGMGRQDYETETLIATGGSFDPITFNGRQDPVPSTKTFGSLDTDPNTQAVAFCDLYNQTVETGASPTLTQACGGTNTSGPKLLQKLGVRRLTPTECERLQGFPDGHTLVTYRGKPAADGPRYKAIGNSMAVPVMRWIGERIEKVERAT